MTEARTAARPATSAMVPHRHLVTSRRVETHDTVTLGLCPVDPPLPPFRPGQFAMLYAFGVGEVPISVSGIPASARGELLHTVRAVGAVSQALCQAAVGTVLGARGPFGTEWEPAGCTGQDLLIVAGGVGLAPVRPLLLHALANRAWYRRVVLVAGARTPGDLLYRAELTRWGATPGLEVELTVDRPAPGWDGPVGFVTEPLRRVPLDPAGTVAFVCGPEPMMAGCAGVLTGRGVPADRIRLSLERNMKCGAGLCGHCQLGPVLVCRDGPVVSYRQAAPLLAVPEL